MRTGKKIGLGILVTVVVAVTAGGFLVRSMWHNAPRPLRTVAIRDVDNWDMKFLDQGTTLLTYGGRPPKLLNALTGEIKIPFSDFGEIYFVKTTPRGDLLLARFLNHIYIYDVATGQKTLTLSRKTSKTSQKYDEGKTITSVHFIDNGNRVFALYEDDVWIVWDAHTGNMLEHRSAPFARFQGIDSTCMDTPDYGAAKTAQEKQIVLDDCTRLRNHHSLHALEPLPSPNGQLLVTADVRANELVVWNLASGKKQCTLPNTVRPTKNVDVPPWDFNRPGSLENHVAFSEDSQHLLVVLAENVRTGKAWWLRVQDCHVERETAPSTKGLSFVQFLPHDRVLLGGSPLDTQVWNLKTGERTYPFRSWITQKYMDLRRKFPFDYNFDRDDAWNEPWEFYPRAIHLDPSTHEAYFATNERIYVWSLGDNWKSFE